jgi:predicted GH43/DUF377 family glycosyl hydrolase
MEILYFYIMVVKFNILILAKIDPTIFSPKLNWNFVYGIGYAIIDSSKPPKVLYKSDKPIFSPTLDWETCNGTTKGFSPNLVKATSWLQTSVDTFRVYYQACDSFVGVGEIIINWV